MFGDNAVRDRFPLLPVYFGLGAVFGSFVGSLTGSIVLVILIGAVLGIATWSLDVLLNKYHLSKP